VGLLSCIYWLELQGMRRSHLILRRLHSTQDKAGRRRFRVGASDIDCRGVQKNTETLEKNCSFVQRYLSCHVWQSKCEKCGLLPFSALVNGARNPTNGHRSLSPHPALSKSLLSNGLQRLTDLRHGEPERREQRLTPTTLEGCKQWRQRHQRANCVNQ
jgi:hypothetical protein